MPIVYRITCIATGRIYFGWTISTLKKRFSKHCRANKNYYISRCINKFGKENFTAEILFNCATNLDAAQKEKQLIAEHKTNICKYPDGIGMNMTDGGEWGTSGYRHTWQAKEKIRRSSEGRKHSEKTKKLIGKNSKELIRKPHSEEWKKNLSEKMKEKWKNGFSGNKGMKFSEDVILKMSKAKLGKKKSQKTKEKMSISAKKRWRNKKLN